MPSLSRAAIALGLLCGTTAALADADGRLGAAHPAPEDAGAAASPIEPVRPQPASSPAAAAPERTPEGAPPRPATAAPAANWRDRVPGSIQ